MRRLSVVTFFVALIALTTLSAPTLSLPAHAQLRRQIQSGISGVELSVEGPTRVPRGSTARWSVQAFEVRGLSDLRVARRSRVTLASSLSDSAIVVEPDDNGRGVVSLPIPLDAASSVRATLTLDAGGATRRFSLPFETYDARRLTAFGPRRAAEGSTTAIYFRLVGHDGPLAGRDIRYTLRDEDGPLAGPQVVSTNDAGIAQVPVRARRNSSRIQLDAFLRNLEARVGESQWQGATSYTLEVVPQPEQTRSDTLVVQGRARNVLVPSGNTGSAEVFVRRADGRPVAGAIVRLSPSPSPSDRRRDREHSVTDASGRAVITVESSRLGVAGNAGFRDVNVPIYAAVENVGSASTTVLFRVTSREHAGTFVVESGALTPEVDSQIHVLAVTMDGAPAANVSVAISGTAFQRQQARTDASGLATFNVRVGDTSDEGDCGGAQATSLVLEVAGHSHGPRCVFVDTLQSVRPTVALRASDLEVSLARRSFARRMPVEVALFNGQQLLDTKRASPSENQVSFAVPARYAAMNLTVRARALDNEGRPLRGGIALYRPRPDGRSLRVTGSRNQLDVSAGSEWDGWSAIVTATPSPGQVAVPRPISDWLSAVSVFRRDLGASYAFRTEAAPGQALVSQPVADGAPLRDPWRTSERFVEGRLGLLFRALENHVDATMPGAPQDVVVENRGRLEFKDGVFGALGDEALGAEGATGLGGRPLTIEEITQVDRGFDFDAVARRVTRKRLFMTIVALRDFVQRRDFDLPWATPGDPNEWLSALNGAHVEGYGTLVPRTLADAWGTPFELRRFTRPTERLVMPVPGYELVSAGPDRRFGTRDDMRDPTAEVLAGGLYADAVGEADLVARLRGVELGRASAAALAEIFGTQVQPIYYDQSEEVPAVNAPRVPPMLPDTRLSTFVQRSTVPAPGSTSALSNASRTSLSIDEEPRVWHVHARGFGPNGENFERSYLTTAGSSLFVVEEFPDRLRLGEPYEAQLSVVSLFDSPAHFSFVPDENAISVTPMNGVTVAPEQLARIPVVLSAGEVGQRRIAIDVTSENDTRRVERRVHVIRGLHPIRRSAFGLGPFRSTLSVPSNAEAAETRLVVVRADRVDLDPEFVALQSTIPGVLGWARVLRGEALPPSIRTSLLRETIRPIDVAPAYLALSGSFNEDGSPDPEAATRRSALLSELSGGALPDVDPEAGVVRLNATRLTALASGGVDTEPWRIMLRRALRQYPDEPTLLARAAGALLVADARDGHGRVMVDRALRAVGQDGLVHASENRPGRVESVSATLALAIAVHQLGDRPRARALFAAAARQGAIFSTEPSEATFWWVAASSYGVMRHDGELDSAETESSEAESGELESVQISAGASSQAVDLSRGVSSVPLDVDAGDSIRVSSEAPVVFRLESVFGLPFDERQDGPLALAIRGAVGELSGSTGLELVIRASEEVSAPIVDIQLPAGPALSERQVASMTASGAVESAEMRSSGILRLVLRPLRSGQEIFIPLMHRWMSGSTVTGFGAVAYPAYEPSAMSVISPRRLTPEP